MYVLFLCLPRSGKQSEPAVCPEATEPHPADGAHHGVLLPAVLDALRPHGPGGHLWGERPGHAGG